MNDYLNTTIYTGDGRRLGELNIDPITGKYFIIFEDESYDYYEDTTEFFD